MTTASETRDTVLSMSAETIERRETVRRFMEENIYPNEHLLSRRNAESEALMKELQQKTKAMDYWAPHLPKEAGGMGISWLTYAYMNEIIGRSMYAPRAFGSQAPDSGNAEILWQYGSP